MAMNDSRNRSSPWDSLLTAPTADEVRAAQLVAAAAATDPDDLRDLLGVLGIDGYPDAIAADFNEQQPLAE
jgi:hypothetical protein